MKLKRFPVLGGVTWKLPENCPESVPWELVAPHEAQAMRNHCGQTLKRLAERGGLGPCEMVAVLEDRPWKTMPLSDAVKRLRELVWPERDPGSKSC